MMRQELIIVIPLGKTLPCGDMYDKCDGVYGPSQNKDNAGAATAAVRHLGSARARVQSNRLIPSDLNV